MATEETGAPMNVTTLRAVSPHVPLRLDMKRWTTRPVQKRVLAVVHTVTSGQRLLEAVRLLRGDPRVQLFFTAAPDVFDNGVATFLERLGGLALSWDAATQHEFDLALTASYGGLHELHAPVVVLPHGAGFNKFVPAREGTTAGGRNVYGLSRQRLVRDGELIPKVIALAHHQELTRLGQECPEALPVAEVVGDPCFDRVAASLPARARYREALGVGPGQKFVLACSTWGRGSLFGAAWELLDRLVAELPGHDYRCGLLLHPNAWNAHGEWQVRSWLAELREAGLVIVSQWADWCGAMVAADYVVGDHGSVTLYGTMTPARVLNAGIADADVVPGSPMAELMSVAPRIRADRPLVRQLDESDMEYRPGRHAHIAGRITSEPGAFTANMRRVMYRQLGLREPALRCRASSVARPPFVLPDGGEEQVA
jgi:hypothetical protein